MTDTVVIAGQDPVEDQTKQQQLIDRAARGTDPTAQPDSNGLILGKFKTADDLAKAYKALESKLGAGNKPAETTMPPDPAQTPPTDQKPNSLEITPKPNEPNPDDAKSILEKAGVNFEALQESYLANGKLTDADMETLTKAGFPRTVVDAYLSGLEAQKTAVFMRVHELTGGAEKFNAMRQWAAANMSAEAVAAYNEAMKKGGDAMELALIGLRTKFEAAAGNEPSLLGGRNVSTSATAFASMADMKEAMRDKRYGKDADYTREVERRAAVSKL